MHDGGILYYYYTRIPTITYSTIVLTYLAVYE